MSDNNWPPSNIDSVLKELDEMAGLRMKKEIETLRARLAKIKEHLLIAKEFIDATECTQPCDSRGVCFRCSIEGDILISLKEYRGEG